MSRVKILVHELRRMFKNPTYVQQGDVVPNCLAYSTVLESAFLYNSGTLKMHCIMLSQP